MNFKDIIFLYFNKFWKKKVNKKIYFSFKININFILESKKVK